MSADKAKQLLLATRKKVQVSRRDLLSTGSTLLNLACTGTVNGGLSRGRYYHLVGDTSSGKTVELMTIFAEACRSPYFKDYTLILDNSEDGMLFDVAGFFGKETAKRVQPPAYHKDKSPRYSRTIEDFYYHLDDALNQGPCIYILDSQDALTTEDDEAKFKKRKKAAAGESDDKVAGNFGLSKAKKNSTDIRLARNKLQQTGSILIVVSQTRDRIGWGAQFDPKTRSGGNALTFYATLEMWFSVKQDIVKVVRGKKRTVGILSRIRVKKNRQTGKDCTVEIPIYDACGISDTESCVMYLISEGHWAGNDKKVCAPEFQFEGKTEQLIQHIEANNQEKELQRLVAQCWGEVEDACTPIRKQRYT